MGNKNTSEMTDNFYKNRRYEMFYNEKEKLGEGSYGKVFKVSYRGRVGVWDDFEYAIKKIKIKVKDEKEFSKELKTFASISKLNHKRVMRYSDIWLENYFTIKDGLKLRQKSFTLYIRMELCDRTVDDIIEMLKDDINLVETSVLSYLKYYILSGIFIEILEGLNYLHKQYPQIIHKDLRPDNIFFKFDNNMNYKNTKNSVKIADLGLENVQKYAERLREPNTKHKIYVAPEVRNGQKYDTRADVYSLGMVLKDLLNMNGKGTEAKVKTESVILMSKYENMKVLSNRMTSINVNERPNCEQIFQIKQTWALTAEEFYSEREVSQVLNYHNDNKYFYFFMVQQFYKKGY